MLSRILDRALTGVIRHCGREIPGIFDKDFFDMHHIGRHGV